MKSHMHFATSALSTARWDVHISIVSHTSRRIGELPLIEVQQLAGARLDRGIERPIDMSEHCTRLVVHFLSNGTLADEGSLIGAAAVSKSSCQQRMPGWHFVDIDQIRI